MVITKMMMVMMLMHQDFMTITKKMMHDADDDNVMQGYI